ncbi:multiheme c-type cytochrome [Desulfobacula sp.]|uniref:multiheme c-type cytochrome n=1 Tax=Desulfobacula sp. TaxID=2593537 RepID=UPI00262EAB56|nr:multiheme c-type cytochrome [Desulfobacula sp.]
MKSFATILILIIFSLGFWACSSEPVVDIAAITSQPKGFVGSDTCKMCHLEHFDSWKMTLHSRMLQDAKANEDAIIVPIDEKTIRGDLAKLSDKLKVPADKIYVPKKEEILYTIGSQWKQRYLVKKNDILYISPIQYNADTHRWVNYHEQDWDKRPWLLKCGGCHATGADIANGTFKEPGVACEACHGKGSWHAALPKTAVFEKRNTIVNPAKLTMGVAAQICGSCHNRGKATMQKGGGWPVGYEPGKALAAYYESTSFEAGDVKHVYANEFSKGHHQQFIDWQQSKHSTEGVTCTSCHYVHQIGMPQTRSQTSKSGSMQCFQCHVQVNTNMAHSIHSFANCVGCHMPRIAKSAESGDIRSHVFVTLLPEDTLKNPKVPNSCQTCHKHKNDDLQELQSNWKKLATLPKPVGKAIDPVEYRYTR